ncbi:DUF7800 domain-containing protein [Nocardiopsis chromatogenes]|uniref:DUF7800 domain-containing protein n=1 Tax=Nocardiopsis chromatogenes TaxID=280239 RepID=UPI00034D1884|nr:alkaline phosphatase D family protein [Nocardiopsis chromatogenes]
MDVGADLRLGPVLRKTTPTTATVWVETEAPAEVAVTAGGARARSRTFTVHGHHYALCELQGLAPGSTTPYTVDVDGARVWPDPASEHPPSLVRTPPEGREAPVRMAFGSCRTPIDHSPGAVRRFGSDMLRAYGRRLARLRRDGGDEGHGGEGPGGEGATAVEEPAVLLLIGDQVYADELQPGMKEFLARRRARVTGDGADARDGVGPGARTRAEARPPEDEVVFFDEYAELYRRSWTDPDVRWLLSTVPTLMLFDDHDVRDDWNTSGAWRAEMDASPWWGHRIVSGLGAYWVYQHLGNLTGEERKGDPLYREVLTASSGDAAADGGDAAELLDAAALGWHEEPQSRVWSHEHRMGPARLLMVDTRAGRDVSDEHRRDILGAPGAAWLDERLTGDTDHLLIASTLPFLLPKAVHRLEAWDEALASGAWGERLRGPAEKLRRALDLEHWAAFGRSFGSVSRTLVEVASGRRGNPPATALFLSGDVHFSYLARARPSRRAARQGAPGGGTRIAQLVSSPLCNRLPTKLRWAARLAAAAPTAWAGWIMARTAGVRPPLLEWKLDEGPWFDNAIAELVLDGRRAEVVWIKGRDGASGELQIDEDGPHGL